jgi:hypothetical protein
MIRSTLFRKTLSGFGALLATVPVAFGDFVIEKNGPVGGIVVDAAAPDSVHLAARELQSYLRRVSGAEVPIQKESEAGNSFTIYLGDTAFAREKGIDTANMKPDGFRILSDENWMIIAGKDYSGPPMTGYDNPYRLHESYNDRLKISAFGDTGTLQGVYEFLRTTCGIRWYMPGPLGEIVPEKERLPVEKTDVQKHPEFQQRYAYFCFFSSSDDDVLWYKRVGFGTPFPVQISHSFGKFFLKYKDTNPEYFAIIDGEPDFTNRSTVMGEGNYNLTNPGLIRQAVKDINEYIEKNPNQKIIPLSPNDGLLRISEDPESQAQLDLSKGEDGKFSNYIWGFVNKVAIEVGKTHPDRLIGCLAYGSYGLPPSNIEKLAPNVAVMLCKLRRFYNDPVYLKKQRDITEAWLKKADTIYTWEYYCELLFNPGWRGFPVFYPNIVQEDLQHLKGHVLGEFLEAESWTYDQYANPAEIKINYPGLQHPLLYVTSQMLWNPNQDLKAILDEYYRLFYGPAEPAMRKFWGAAETAWMERGTNDSPSSVYRKEPLQKMLSYLEEARELTAPGSDYRKRVDLIEKEFSPAAQQTARLAQLKARSDAIPPMAEGGKVDGVLVEEAWSKSGLISMIDRGYQPATPATHIRLGWTPEALKIAIVAFEPFMKTLKMDVTPENQQPDSRIWEDDSVEIFLQPKGGETVYHFVVNAAGALYDASNSSNTWSGEDPSWKSNSRWAVRREKDSWILEMSIPWESLGVRNGEAGRELVANIYRNRYATGKLDQYSWAPMIEGMYFAPHTFGTLTLSGESKD